MRSLSSSRPTSVRRGLPILIAAVCLPAAARADTAAPFMMSFGRLVDPAALAQPNPTDTFVAVEPAGRAQSLECLAQAIAYEAGREPAAGQAAVAQVVLNRVQHPAFPKTVCDVIHQGRDRRTGCQFSYMCDGSLRRQLGSQTWARARAVAAAVLDGQRDPVIGRATHYHANYVSPYWAPALVRLGAIGAHIFYRFPGPARAALPTPPVASGSTSPDTTGKFAPWGLVLVPPVEGP